MRSRTAPKEAGSRWFQAVYEVALLAALVIFALAPLHHWASVNANVAASIDPTHVAVDYAGAPLRDGDFFPVYRFNATWKTQIGEAKVNRVDGQRVTFSYDPASFRWPMGRQASVDETAPGVVSVAMGGRVGLAPGDQLALFLGREPIGRIQLTEVGATTSKGIVLAASRPIAGAVASEFLVPTQIVIFNSPLVSLIEILVAALLLGGYGAGWIVFRKSPVQIVGGKLRSAVLRLATARVALVAHFLLGIPLVWLASRFLVGICVRLVEWTLPGMVRTAEPRLYAILLILYIAGGAAYLWVLITTRQAPALVFWRAIRFQGGPLKILKPGPARDIATWILHLAIAYAFAFSLFTFLAGDMNAALDTAWPNSGIRVQGGFSILDPGQIRSLVGSMTEAFGFMLSHRPQLGTSEAFYVTVRYILWTLTIIGCLVGYGHSVLGYAWGQRIRNLDFTWPGWITNAVCYGPLLGAVWWLMFPPLLGPDPIFASGPLLQLDLATELLLNVVYMLTIWNLGVMFGVMTDKGVRTTGFYSVVRHPSYTMEALMFVALELKGLTGGGQWLAAGMFLLIYWIRSEREDQFMASSNPDYEAYRTRTRYKFIPGLY